MKKLTCIICPRGCALEVDDNMNVTGNFCPRGKIYAQKELTNPTRTITSFVNISNRENLVAPVKTSADFPKNRIFDVMNEIAKISVTAPCQIGDIVMENVLGLGIDIVIAKNID